MPAAVVFGDTQHIPLLHPPGRSTPCALPSVPESAPAVGFLPHAPHGAEGPALPAARTSRTGVTPPVLLSACANHRACSSARFLVIQSLNQCPTVDSNSKRCITVPWAMAESRYATTSTMVGRRGLLLLFPPPPPVPPPPRPPSSLLPPPSAMGLQCQTKSVQPWA